MTPNEFAALLLDATPAPPSVAATALDIDLLLAELAILLDRRAKLIATYQPSADARPADPQLRDELVRRDAAWAEVLERTRALVGGSRVESAKLRAYAASASTTVAR